MSDAGGRVRYELGDDGVAVVTLDSPARRNAATYPMMAELFGHLEHAGADPACRVVVLTGAGGTFCAGTDLRYLETIPPEERGYPGRLHDDEGWWNVVACPKPVIAAVDGAAVGMGAEWATMADVRIATPRARFAWNFVHRGLVPDTGAGSWLLPRLIGVPAALRLLYSGDSLTAPDALACGFVSAVVEPGDLLPAARAEAARWLRGGPEAVARTKRLVYAGLARGVAEHQADSRAQLLECFRSAEHAEGVAAFLEGRPPRFAGAPGAQAGPAGRAERT
ncbi:enoyl-CoA hydratase/isomerase family protein [Blastococcus sp. SYSU D00820]